MSPVGSTGPCDINADAEPAAGSHDALTFSLDELKKRIGERLGGGMFGVVYAVDGFPNLAVKEILLDGLDQHSIDAAKLELATLPALSHPGVLKYHQVLVDDSFAYIVMDRHDTSLGVLITKHRRRREPIPTEMTVALAAQITGALAYLHSAHGVDANGDPYQGVVHRDLKPANILVSEDGSRVVLADFGLCKDAQHDGITVVGTLLYMAPEVFIHHKTSRASDIWALGVITYELATLKRPDFTKTGRPENVFTSGWSPDLSPVKDDFIREILERIFVLDPEERPTAKELAELFQKPDISKKELKAQVKTLEASLDSANMKVEFLERSLGAKTDEVNGLKKTLTTKSAEIDSLKKELETKSTKIDALEKQFTKATEDLKGARRQHKLEMDQQRRETARQKKRLDAALKTANNEIASLKKELEEQHRFTPMGDWTPLMRAAFVGDIEAARTHLTDRNKKNNKGDTALIIAAREGHGDIVSLLNPTDKKRVTALMRAAARGDAKLVELLVPIQKGMKDEDGSTAFVHALKSKHADVAMILLEHEAPSWTLLMCAAFIGDIELARSHLSDRDKKNGDGDTALMIAARAGHADVVELLDPTDKAGVTALMRAADRNDVEAVRALIPLQKGRKTTGCIGTNRAWIFEGTALMIAAAYGHTEVVRLLVEHEMGMRDSYGYTALMMAARNSRTGCVKLLLEKEAGIRDNQGWTALILAARSGYVECIKLLVKREGGMRDAFGKTALMYAAQGGHTGCIKLLIEKESKVQDKDGVTALMVAAENGNSELITLLLEKEGGMQTVEGWTALVKAAEKSHVECADLLMEREDSISGWTDLIRAAYRGDVNAVKRNLHMRGNQDVRGWTALMYAVARGHTKVAKLLAAHEGGMQDTDGETALMSAAKKDHSECVRLLIKREACMQKNSGWTALMWAAFQNKPKCARLLAKKERDMKSAEGETALDIARKWGRTEIVSILRK